MEVVILSFKIRFMSQGYFSFVEFLSIVGGIAVFPGSHGSLWCTSISMGVSGGWREVAISISIGNYLK